jgi:hypothetical protein
MGNSKMGWTKRGSEIRCQIWSSATTRTTSRGYRHHRGNKTDTGWPQTQWQKQVITTSGQQNMMFQTSKTVFSLLLHLIWTSNFLDWRQQLQRKGEVRGWRWFLCETMSHPFLFHCVETRNDSIVLFSNTTAPKCHRFSHFLLETGAKCHLRHLRNNWWQNNITRLEQS